jgi:hypothetical protein
MSISEKIQQTVKKISQSFLAMFDFVAAPVLRIFKPTEHTYPGTGVQPYEGDPNKDQR